MLSYAQKARIRMGRANENFKNKSRANVLRPSKHIAYGSRCPIANNYNGQRNTLKLQLFILSASGKKG